jgi:hypothetical protein
MTYQKYGRIEASDYNSYTGTISSVTANQLNTILGVGNAAKGWGQVTGQTAVVPQVLANDATYQITAVQWNALINGISKTALHQGSTITPIALDSVGDLISSAMTAGASPQSIFANNLVTIYTNRNNCAAQGATQTSTIVMPTTWKQQLTFTHTITFSDVPGFGTAADAARYFFNAGGQISFTFSHPNGTGVNEMWNNLATSCGTITLSSPISGVVNIAGLNFNGVTKTNGTGTAVINSNYGYYALSAINNGIFSQTATVGPAGYVASNISIAARSNGVQGTNGDAGSTITFTTLWDEIPDGGSTALGTSSAGSTVTCTVRPPGTTYISKSWGTIGLSGYVSGV